MEGIDIAHEMFKDDPWLSSVLMHTIGKNVPMKPENKKKAEQYAKDDFKKAVKKEASKLIDRFLEDLF
jgi:hypothetical protein